MVVHPLESSGRRSRSVRGALPSIAVHAAIILVAVHATAHAALPHDAPRESVFIDYVRTDPAPPAERPPVTTPASDRSAPLIPDRRLVVPPLTISDHIPPVSVAPGTPIISSKEFGHGVAPAGTLESDIVPEHGGTPFAASAVDRAVTPLGGPPTPAYPEALRASGIRGSVAAEFVVDTTGHVEPGSFHILASDNDLFSAAVRAAVLRTRFRPAEAVGRRVRQLVQQRFSFVLQ